MTERTTGRERILLSILPAALVLGLYAFLFAIPEQKIHQQKSLELKAAQAKAIDKSVAEMSRSNVELVRAGLKRQTEQTRSDRESITYHGKQWSNGNDRLSNVQQLTELLAQFRLSIVKQDFQAEPQLSGYHSELRDIVMSHTATDELLEYWQIELAGSYGDMLKFLNEINHSGLRTVPVAVSMQASTANDGVHSWTLVFVV